MIPLRHRAAAGPATEGGDVKRLFVAALLVWAAPAAADSVPAARLGSPLPAHIARGTTPDPFFDDLPSPAARLGPLGPAQIGTGPADASPDERYNWGVPSDRRATDSGTRNRDPDDEGDRRGARLREPVPGRTTGLSRISEQAGDWLDERGRDARNGFPDRGNRDRVAFQSDCAFDAFASPVTNPFLAEDPRSLTELRPLFLFQTIPSKQFPYLGGNAETDALQGRVAFTDRLSLVLHKLAGQTINPGGASTLNSSTGFAEVWLGPKFVFWRNPDDQVIASAGLMFQLPFGTATVYQDTGSLSLVPYFSYAQRLWKTGWGTWNVMNTVGYSISTNNQRSDFLYDTVHLDLNAADGNRFYPFLEMSWFHYTSNGHARPSLGFEGRDLANVGAPVRGRDLLTIAPGVRFKLTEAIQFGLATEFPLLGSRDLHQFRLGIDMIWRY